MSDAGPGGARGGAGTAGPPDEDAARDGAATGATDRGAAASTTGDEGWGAGDAPERGDQRFDPRMLEALVCPVTQERLDWDAERAELVSRKAGLAYPVRDGIPIMLEGEARRLED